MHQATRVAALLLALTLPLTACSPGEPAPSGGVGGGTGGGGTLTRAMTSEPTSFDPHGPANSGLNLVLPYLFDTPDSGTGRSSGSWPKAGRCPPTAGAST